jgi:hypothetical protein
MGKGLVLRDDGSVVTEEMFSLVRAIYAGWALKRNSVRHCPWQRDRGGEASQYQD